MGFVIIGAGATVLIGSLDIFGDMFDHAFNVQGVIPNNEAIVAAAQSQFGTSTALIMVFGMVTNIVLARITPFKFIFLTGHHTLFMAPGRIEEQTEPSRGQQTQQEGMNS